MFGLTAQDFADALYTGLAGYIILVAVSGMVGVIMVRVIQRRVATFMLLTFGMFTEFLIGFYGFNLAVPYFTDLEETLGFTTLFILSVLVPVIAIFLTAFFMRWHLTEIVSPYEREIESLSEEELSQFDKTRREYMQRRRDIGGRGKGV